MPASWIRLERIWDFLNVGGWKLVWLIEEDSFLRSWIWVCQTRVDCLNGFPVGKQIYSNENESY